MIYTFGDFTPVVHPSSFVHPQAAVTGNVIIGKHVYVGPGAAIRGDWGAIVIEDGCNVQENCTLHMFPGATVLLRAGSHIGHGAVIHGATIGRDTLVGMNSVVMDDAEIGDECIIGALSLVKANEKVPRRSIFAGSPAKRIGEVSDDMLTWKQAGTRLYQQLPAQMHAQWSATEALPEMPAHRPQPPGKSYAPWNSPRQRPSDSVE